MLMAIGAIIAGLILLVWSADKFVEGSATTASHFGMPPLLIGMVVVGFGTSAPEMAVSALAASQGDYATGPNLPHMPANGKTLRLDGRQLPSSNERLGLILNDLMR